MDSLAEDLLLVAIDPANGVLHCRDHLSYGLMGAELVMLVGAGLVEVTGDRVIALQPAGLNAGDVDLDAALSKLAAAKQPLKVRRWISRPRRKIVNGYLDRLIAADTIQRTGGALRPRWPVTDLARAALVRQRLDAIVLGSGEVDEAQAAYPGLVDAIGLAAYLYRGRENRPVRNRLRDITKTHWAAEPVRRAVAAAEAASAG